MGDDIMAKWDGHNDRRINERRKDWPCGVCAEHEIIQNGTKEHRSIVCAKIAEVKDTVRNKADIKDLRGAMKTIAILVGICIAVVAGQAVWLKSDIAHIGNIVQRVNVRITETVNDRISMDIKQTQQLGAIEGQLSTINWRIGQLEESHKPVNKFIPDK